MGTASCFTHAGGRGEPAAKALGADVALVVGEPGCPSSVAQLVPAPRRARPSRPIWHTGIAAAITTIRARVHPDAIVAATGYHPAWSRSSCPKWEDSEFVSYVVGILAMVGGILLERIVVGSHSTAGTGYARVDSAFGFDRLRRKRYSARARSVLRRGGRPTLPLLREATREPWQLRRPANSSSRSPASWGSVDGASQLFDRNFRPVSDRSRARLGSVLVAMRQDEPLPPIEVWAWRGEYYVLDGHHRVAAARALGSDHISTHVIEVVALSRYDAKALRV
jgi:hypothetical protein